MGSVLSSVSWTSTTKLDFVGFLQLSTPVLCYRLLYSIHVWLCAISNLIRMHRSVRHGSELIPSRNHAWEWTFSSSTGPCLFKTFLSELQSQLSVSLDPRNNCSTGMCESITIQTTTQLCLLVYKQCLNDWSKHGTTRVLWHTKVLLLSFQCINTPNFMSLPAVFYIL